MDVLRVYLSVLRPEIFLKRLFFIKSVRFMYGISGIAPIEVIFEVQQALCLVF